MPTASPPVPVRVRSQRGCRSSFRLASASGSAAWAVEIPEELAVGRKQHARVRRLYAGLVGLHRTIEAKKVGITVERVGKDAVALCIALASGLLGLAGRLALDDGALAVGVGANAVGRTRTLGAELSSLALTLGTHAVEHVLLVLVGQVGALDTHVHHLESELLAFLVDLLGDLLHQRLALVTHEIREGGAA